MLDERRFVQAIQASPDDEVPRLIYADWLDEHGDPRGEFIRVQCELARRSNNDPHRKILDQRESELLEGYGETWLEPLRELGAMGVSVRYFHRGMLEHVKLSAEDFLERAETLCQLEPALHRVQLTNVGPHLGQLAIMQLPSQITALDLSANQLAPAECQILAASSRMTQLKELDLKFNRLGDEGATELSSADWPNLERLDLSGNRIGPEGATAFVTRVSVPNLTILLLSMNRIAEGAPVLFGSHSVGRLEELHLASNGITDAAANQMMGTHVLTALQVLNLRYNRISVEGQQRLKAMPLSQRLRLLDLTGNSNPVH